MVKAASTRNARKFFKVLQTTEKLQTATMTLRPGQESGPYGDEHPASEQILLVLKGTVAAQIGKKRKTLREGDVVIVPRRTAHRFFNRSKSIAVTFNVYSPPAY